MEVESMSFMSDDIIRKRVSSPRRNCDPHVLAYQGHVGKKSSTFELIRLFVFRSRRIRMILTRSEDRSENCNKVMISWHWREDTQMKMDWSWAIWKHKIVISKSEWCC